MNDKLGLILDFWDEYTHLSLKKNAQFSLKSRETTYKSIPIHVCDDLNSFNIHLKEVWL